MKLTTKILKKMILDEASKFGNMRDVEDVKAEEVDADKLADALEKHIDYVKALKIEESRLKKRLAKIAETRTRIAKTLLGSN
jgi:regulator of replication initiation timing